MHFEHTINNCHMFVCFVLDRSLSTEYFQLFLDWIGYATNGLAMLPIHRNGSV